MCILFIHFQIIDKWKKVSFYIFQLDYIKSINSYAIIINLYFKSQIHNTPETEPGNEDMGS